MLKFFIFVENCLFTDGIDFLFVCERNYGGNRCERKRQEGDCVWLYSQRNAVHARIVLLEEAEGPVGGVASDVSNNYQALVADKRHVGEASAFFG